MNYYQKLDEVFLIELEKYKIDPKFVGDYAQRLKDFPKKDVYNMAQEIIADLDKIYLKPKSFNKEYEIKTENPSLKGYTFEISVMPSNNITAMDDTQQHWAKIKMLKPDSYAKPTPEQLGRSFERLKLELTDLLMHEAGHYYLQKHTGKEDEISYFQGGFDKKQYFWDPEEVVLHSYAAWRRTKKSLKNNILDYPKEEIEKLVKRQVANIPAYAQASHIPFPVSLQKKYVSYIMKNIVEPKLKNKDMKDQI